MPKPSPLPGLYKTTPACSGLKDILVECGKLPKGGWIFRGHRDFTWNLEHTLERAIERFDVNPADASRLEGGLLRRFQRHAQHYLSDAPAEEDFMEWLAIMQHHGAPTRLLDWSHSIFIAAFFALDQAEKGKEAAIWALNWDQLSKTLTPDIDALIDKYDRNVQKRATFENAFQKPSENLIIKVNPFRLNERLVIQQGTFLVPTNVAATFEANLAAALKKPGQEDTLVKLRIASDTSTQAGILTDLFRMNLTPATLYPGLDGFARSLTTILLEPRILEPPVGW